MKAKQQHEHIIQYLGRQCGDRCYESTANFTISYTVLEKLLCSLTLGLDVVAVEGAEL